MDKEAFVKFKNEIEALINEEGFFNSEFSVNISKYNQLSLNFKSWLFFLIYASDEAFKINKDKFVNFNQSNLGKKELFFYIYSLLDSNNIFLYSLRNEKNKKFITNSFERIKEIGFDFNSLIKDNTEKYFLLSENGDNHMIYFDNLSIGKSWLSLFVAQEGFFKKLLELGANPKIKNKLNYVADSFFTDNKIEDKFEKILENYKSIGYIFKDYQVGSIVKDYQVGRFKQEAVSQLKNERKIALKNYEVFNDKDSLQIAIILKKQGAINVLKSYGFIEDQKIDKYSSLKDLIEQIRLKNKEVLNSLEDYSFIIENDKNYGKNLLFYAIELGALDWVKVLVEKNMVSKDDVGGAGQQAIIHALNKNKKKIVDFLYDNDWLKGDFLNDKEEALKIFSHALVTNKDFALRIQQEQKLPIIFYDFFLKKYSSSLNKENIELNNSLIQQEQLKEIKEGKKTSFKI